MEFDATGDELTGQATQWLVGLDSGRVDEAQFEAWRAADPRHAAAFAQVLATWERTGALRASPLRPDAPFPGETAPRAPALTRRRMMAGGAVAAVLAGTVSGALLLGGRSRMITQVGERRTVRLPDGSAAELNTDTLLSWDFSGARKVWLERGEVALSVNEARTLPPLLLHGHGLRARLQPGRYNLRLYADGPVLTAFSGGGEIRTDSGAPMRLAPMQRVSERGGAAQARAITPSDADAASAWRRGEIVFNGMPLDRAILEFNRYLDRKLVIGDPQIGAIRLGGRFFVDDPDSFLRSLHEGFNIAASPGPDGIVLRAA